MQSFNRAQTFFIDPGVVGGAPQVMLSAVDLFFQAKPDRTNNASGIQNPGVSLFVVETIYGVPKIDNTSYEIARAEYDQIATTSDATIPTRFRFRNTVPVTTGKEYAMVIIFDGSENFQVWSSKVGDFLIDTKKVSPGPSGKYIGKYFDYTNSAQNFNTTDPTQISAALSADQYQSFWTPLTDTDLKFRVYCARYATNGVPISSNTNIPNDVQVVHTPVLKDTSANNEVYLYPSSCLEMIIFDQASSVKESFVGGQWAYQNTFSYPGGYANGSSSIKVSVNGSDRVTANSKYPNGASFAWSAIYPTVGLSQSNDSPYIVLKDATGVNVRKVVSVVSNTIIQLDEPATFVNAAAEFLLTPVGIVDSFNKSAPYGEFVSIVVLANSSANGTLRFVNNAISNATIVANGSGYSNSDVLYVTGYENTAIIVTGGYKAVANIVTNANGSIQNIYFSNLGCGFVNSAAMAYFIMSGANSNPTSNTSAGTGANISFGVGSSIRTELRNNQFNSVTVANFPLSDVIPYFDIDHPAGTTFDIKFTCQYWVQANSAAVSGYAYYVNDNSTDLSYPVQMFVKNQFHGSKVPVLVSRSNEFITRYSNGAANDKAIPGATSNALVMVVNSSSNSDFICVGINSIPTIALSSYLVNDDYTNENTDQGNAWARQITTKINFTRPAEDVLVYLTAYKPANTDIQVYARIHNSSDAEYFEDKDWTWLEPQFSNLVSSSTDTTDQVELTFGLQQFPNTDLRLAGPVTGTNGSNIITGSNTFFSNNLVAGDLVKISNPLFANTYMIDVVNSVTNNTSLTLNNPITNVNFATYGLVVDRIRTFKHQAFNYQLNDNVARYYTSSMVVVDTYDTMQIKVVMLSDRPNIVPRVDDIRAIGVSA